MKIHKATNNESPQNMALFYKSLSLAELIARIVDESDRRALEEFHNNRTVFCCEDGDPLRFIEYLNRLRDSAINRGKPSRNSFEIADKAFDMTLDKFNNLPCEAKLYASKRDKRGHLVKQEGSDCRFYFKAFLNHLSKSLRGIPAVRELEQEARASKSMQGLVDRHFYLSILEAERSTNRLWSRYYWIVNSQKICIWLPVFLKGRDRQLWLEKNISEPDPIRPGERQRIQAIINRKMIRGSIVSFNDAIEIKNNNFADHLPEWEETAGISLAKVVAEEKAMNIQKLRRSIRILGKTKLKKMIMQIFENISYDDYRDSEIAKSFGLTKATYSRFAGSRWNQTGSSIPDLWLNTAQVFKEHPIFRQVAKNTGFWDKVVGTIKRNACPIKKEKSND